MKYFENRIKSGNTNNLKVSNEFNIVSVHNEIV